MWSTTSQTLTQVFTPFGGGYIQEHHGDEVRSYLAAPEVGETIDFGAVLAALRAALFLR
jgi:hypothetical protein